jgi:uncharacterized protein YyaL (SSP411 family)
LREARAKRVWPGRDDKVLTAWTAMMIKSFAQAARVLNRQDYLVAATKATEFLLTVNRKDGKLLRSYKSGQAKFNAYQEDYAYLIDALISLYEATFQTKWILEARCLADLMIKKFWDQEEGGFFFTSDDHEHLITRSKEYSDNATPSGNSIAVDALLKLKHIFNDDQYERIAVKVLHMLSKALEKFPGGFGHMLGALDFHLAQVKEIAVIGSLESLDTKELLDVIYQTYLPNKVVALAEPSDQVASEAISLLANRGMIEGKATAYVCENFTCKQPITRASELSIELNFGRS